MGIEAYFKGSKILGTIIGKREEYLNLSRFSKGTSRAALNNVFKALLQSDTLASDGDIFVIDSVSYFVTAMRTSSTGTIMCQLQKTNATIDIFRVSKHYTGSTQDYLTEVEVSLAVPSFFEDITGRMIQYDAGLLKESTRRFLMPLLSQVKLSDRIRFNSEAMQIIAMNTSSYPGLLQVQTMVDSRVTR